MSKKINFLLALGLAQLLIIGVIWFSGDSGQDEAVAWLTLEDPTTRLVISDADLKIELSGGPDAWQVAGLPADADKVQAILDKLGDVTAAWPVATTDAAKTRFEVAEDTFQRRLQLFAGEALQSDLLFGTSPGYQRVHARQASQDEIYSVALSNYELPLTEDDWLDKALLATLELPSDIRVSFPASDSGPAREVQLSRSDEGWLVDGAAADQNAAETYANRFKTLRVLGRAGDAAASALQLAEISLTTPDGEQQLTLARTVASDAAADPAEQSGDYIVTANGNSFTLATYIAEQLLLTDVSLAAAEPADSAETEISPGASPETFFPSDLESMQPGTE